MAAHATLGASNAHRWMACPGSVRLEATLPPEPSSPHAREGTAAHALLELCLAAGLHPDTFVGQEVEGWEVTSEMARAVAVAYDHVQYLITEEYPGAEMGLEQRVQIRLLDTDRELFGTADVVLVRGHDIHVIDYKHGRGVYVPAQDNPQGKYYLAGACELWQHQSILSASFTIVQPRCPGPDGDVIRTMTMDAADMEQWYEELQAAVDAVDGPDPALNPGDKQCRWCRAKAICPALKERALEVAQEEFPVAALSPEEMGELLDKADLAEAFIKAIRAHAHAEAERGVEVLGWKLAPRRARRYWTDEDEVMEWAEGFDTDARELLLPRSLVSPAKAEKILGKKNVPDTLIESRSSGTKLVRDSTPGKAIQAPLTLPVIEGAESP